MLGKFIKRRRRNSKKMFALLDMRTEVLIALSLGVLVLGYLLYQLFVPPALAATGAVIIEVDEGESLSEITQSLDQNGLIRSKLFMSAYARLMGASRNLQAGSYELSPAMNLFTIVHKLHVGDTVSLVVRVPEGETVLEIEGLLEEACLKYAVSNCEFDLQSLTVDDFADEFFFLEDIDPNTSLEGFLFPDTYTFSLGVTAEEAAAEMLDVFSRKAFSIIADEPDWYEALIMASLIEREVPTLRDKKLVSGVLQNRLELGMRLQVDATIIYFTRRTVTLDDTKIEHPYNTYRNDGLPPGPIANPGETSFIAAVSPTPNNYLFYLSARDGTTIFSHTFAEHTANRNFYLR